MFRATADRLAAIKDGEQGAARTHSFIGELAEMGKLGRETVRLLVKDEDGVIKIRLGRKKATRSIRFLNPSQ